MAVAMLFGFGALWHFSHDETLSCSYFPYTSHEVSFMNPASGLQLSGTLTLPNSHRPAPAIILVAGTGKHDRDCTSKGHKLFYAISDYLTHQGVAVLRYDKRGVGQSQGVFDTTLTTADFATDAQAAFEYLKAHQDIDATRIGLLGHSEGGLIVSMLAAASPDVKFLVSMAGAATTSVHDIVQQAAMQIHADGGSAEIIDLDRQIRTDILENVLHEPDHALADAKIRHNVERYLNNLTAKQASQLESLAFESGHKEFEPQAPVYAISRLNSEYMVRVFNSDWVRFLISYDAFATLKHIKAPVLAVNGALDFVVAAQVTLPVWLQGLLQAGNQDITLVEMPGLNHWFEPCKTGSINEYGATSVDISPAFLELIGTWIHDRIK